MNLDEFILHLFVVLAMSVVNIVIVIIVFLVLCVIFHVNILTRGYKVLEVDVLVKCEHVKARAMTSSLYSIALYIPSHFLLNCLLSLY